MKCCWRLARQNIHFIFCFISGEDEYRCKYCDEKFKFCNPHTAHILFKCPKRHLAILQDIPRLQAKSIDARKDPRPIGENTLLVKQVFPQIPKEIQQKRRPESASNENRELEPRESSLTSRKSKHLDRNADRTFSAFRRVDNTSKRSFKGDGPSLADGASSAPRSKVRKEDKSTVQVKKPSPVLPHPKLPFPGSFGLSPPLNLSAVEAVPKIGRRTKSPEMVSFMDHNKLRMPNFLPEPALATGLHRDIAGYSPAAAALVAPPPMLGLPPQMNSMLPATMAAVSFSNENWCAKCNASFRMTSDLVYHMRTHHKREFDGNRKKRDDKLKCQICKETFRERHHLTRHMTSHM